MTRPILFFTIFISIYLVCSGCSHNKPDGIKIKGTVTLDGVPLETGNITFHRKDIDQSFGSVILNGKYETYVQPGEMTVRIAATRQVGTKPRNDFPGDTVIDPVLESIIPEKYNLKTTLNCVVNEKGSEQNFELLSK
ncbi:MAG: hypothetical protein LBE12_14090 [Planctomycetaceae bacterium]|jgi:hypothetical protein|nr:hypothetical protein [Planctomycetaceae bacterium]